LKTRLFTGLALLPVVIILVWAGGWFLFAGVVVVILLAIREFIHMMRVKGHQPSLWLATLFALIPLIHVRFPTWDILTPALTLSMMLALIWQLFAPTRSSMSTPPLKSPTFTGGTWGGSAIDWALSLAGGMYIGFALSHLILLRSLQGGYTWVWLAFFCTWSADTFAYLGGRIFGKRKFWVRHSPNKTWEGIFAGVFGGMFGGIVIMLIFPTIPLKHALIIGILASVVAPLGDLSISMMKRYTGVKDTSNLIPGHGGVLDRIDSLLFVLITVFYYVAWVVL